MQPICTAKLSRKLYPGNIASFFAITTPQLKVFMTVVLKIPGTYPHLSIARHCLTCDHKANSIWSCFPYSFIFFCIKSACSDIQDLHYFFSSWYLLQLHWEKTLLIHYKKCLVDKRKTAKTALREMKYYDLLYCKSFWLENPFSKV